METQKRPLKILIMKNFDVIITNSGLMLVASFQAATIAFKNLAQSHKKLKANSMQIAQQSKYICNPAHNYPRK